MADLDLIPAVMPKISKNKAIKVKEDLNTVEET